MIMSFYIFLGELITRKKYTVLLNEYEICKKSFCHVGVSFLLSFPHHWNFPAMYQKNMCSKPGREPSTFSLPTRSRNILGSILASSDAVESERRQMKQC
jgi:hypothetical protein